MSKEIMVEQGSDSWFDMRLSRATASHAHEILSASSTLGYKKYRALLFTQRFTGKKIDSYSNDKMDDGTVNEPVARLLYSLQTGHKVRESGFWVHDEHDAGASPDGIVNEEFGLEIKTQLPHIHLMAKLDGFIDSKYKKQMDFQMWITGYKKMDFISYSPLIEDAELQLAIVTYERDQTKIDLIEDKTLDLLEEVEEFEGRIAKLRSKDEV